MEQVTARWDRSTGWSTPLPDWDGPGTLVMAFGSADLLDDDAPLRAIATAYGHSVLIGASTSDAILGSEIVPGPLAIAVVRFAHTTLALEVEPAGASRPGAADIGQVLGRRLRQRGDDLAAVIVLSDGTNVNGSTLAHGLADALGASTVILGGLAGDGARFERTWVLVDGRPQEAYVTAVGLYGDRLEVGHGSDGGWTVLGPERLVTRSEGNVLLELDGRPALELYKSYLGDRASGLPATALLFPLGVRAGDDGEREVVRTVLGVDEARQGMTFAGDVPEGAIAQLMRGTTELLVDAAHDAAASARLPGSAPSLGIAVSRVGRRLYLGQRVEDELEAATTALGATCDLVGFYSHGELSAAPGGGCDLQNQTMTITVLRERVA
ncbi:MAG: FIST signal transduction protein [Cellulomonas sp.]